MKPTTASVCIIALCVVIAIVFVLSLFFGGLGYVFAVVFVTASSMVYGICLKAIFSDINNNHNNNQKPQNHEQVI